MNDVIRIHRMYLKNEIEVLNDILSYESLTCDEKNIALAQYKAFTLALYNLESLMELKGVVIDNAEEI